MPSSSKGQGMIAFGPQLVTGSGKGRNPHATRLWKERKRIANQAAQAAGHMVTASQEALCAQGFSCPL